MPVTRQNLREADLTFTWKLIARISAIILAAVAIGLIAWAEIHNVIPVSDQVNSGDGYGYDQSIWDSSEDAFLLPWVHIPLGLSIIWNLANIGVWFTPSRSGRGMHPGANVGCDLILWLILLLTGIFASFAVGEYLSPYNSPYNDDYYGDGYTLSNGTYVTILPNGTEAIDTSQCAPFATCNAAADYSHQLNHRGVVIAVGLAFLFIVMFLHFALFVSACRYTHERRFQNSGRYAKAVTEEATTIATRMVRDMGYPPPGQWGMQQQQPPPPNQWSRQWPQGDQQQFNGAPMAQPHYSMQPKSEGDPQAGHGLLQNDYQEQTGKGKAREDGRELGFKHGSVTSDYGSPSQQHPPPNIRVEGPGGVENGDGGIVR